MKILSSKIKKTDKQKEKDNSKNGPQMVTFVEELFYSMFYASQSEAFLHLLTWVPKGQLPSGWRGAASLAQSCGPGASRGRVAGDVGP